MIKKLFLILTLLGAAGQWASADEDELLPPDEAFQFSAKVVDDATIQADWKIADGYYLYRNKFRFKLDGENVTAGEAQLPPGKVKSDPAFGDVEVYLHNVSASLPLKRGSTEPVTVELEARYQGCNEPVGVCYPPQTKRVSLELPAVAESSAPASPAGSLSSLSKYLDGDASEADFLPVDQAFRLELEPRDKNTLVARFSIADGYYLYRDKMKFAVTAGGKAGSIELPAGEEKEDDYLGKTTVYHNSADIIIPLVNASDKIELKAEFQGCAEQGICYPPVKKTLTVALAGAPAGGAAPSAAAQTAQTSADSEPAVETKSFWGAIVAAFGVGLLLSFTPCVLPMIPILSSMIVGQSTEKPSKIRSGLLSLAYVLGTAVTFTIAGVLAGLTGDQLQAYFQNAWAIGIIAAIFVLMSLSMFGLYEIQMPSFIQSKVQTKTQNMGGGFIPIFIVGMLSALIVGACVSPPLIAALSVAIVKQDPVLGGAIMFAMAMGMGVVLILIGIGAGSLVPKAGTWMDTVKYVFGVMLLAVAIYMLGTLPQVPVLLLWGILFIVIGIYLGATQSLPEGVNGWRYLWKGLGTVLLIWGLASLIGGWRGNRDPLHPLQGIGFGAGSTTASTGTATESGSVFTRVANLAELDQQLSAAKAAGKPVILDYFATWCTDCVRMEKTTFENPEVRSVLKNKFLMLQADVSDPNSAEAKALKKRYGIFGPPAMLFFDASGNLRKDLSSYGYMSPDEFLAHISDL
ncbi:MAG: thiol:disulfide interchange protein [Gammaproteobacteria bacterium]|nr:MAG: thiol:disulfide interchange protein [Gammaproteobacteria bacterium]